ncbi:hypothetical protein [Lutibacter sp.]|uniref:hypothetical protein n=1 Tax=Lutibacter sp. TaxID=1925666 RepID=UPI0025BEA0AC|nr:hypothetical protein [Lutibacter sp.]MCF6182035.1 hypothetical protein [Lutibacter sp.]
MKKLITILILAISVSTFAQTGIGTTTPNTNAQLEVAATNKGFLPPRVALTSTTSASPLAAHVAGMVVYNTATAGDVIPGLYVNNGTAWEKQIGATSINGLYDGKSDGSSIFLGGTGFNDDGANQNTSVGINALYNDTSGTDNVGVGYQASPHTTTGSNNAVIGSYANFLNFGSDNAVLGSYAGYQTNGSGNVLLGNYAGYLSSSQAFNNKLYIENSSSATPLIYGEFDNNLIRINGNYEVSGTVKIESGTPGVGKVLTSDATGLASWVTPAAAPTTTDALTEGTTNLYYTEARVSANTSVATNTAKVTNATHTGDVTGSTVLTIGNAKVTNAKVATGIDAAKFADGTVSNTELQYINTVSSNVQTQLKAMQQYGLFTLSATSTSNLGLGNHCPFNTSFKSNNSMGLITLYTVPYTTALGSSSLGRVNLKGGYRYKISGYVRSSGTTTFYGYSIYNANNGSRIGTFAGGYASPNQDANTGDQGSHAFVSSNTDTLIELRKTGGTIINWYSGNTNLSGSYLMVECLGKI